MQDIGGEVWDGSPRDLVQYEKIVMPRTPNGSMVFGCLNLAGQSNDGELTLTSGGLTPLKLDVPAGANQPGVLVRNWAANDLAVTNTSVNADTTIEVEAFGPGIPGVQPFALAAGIPLSLGTYDTAQGSTRSGPMQLAMRAGEGLTIVAMIGGPRDGAGNNARVFALNFAGSRAPPGYAEVTSGNRLVVPFHWSATAIFVANMSPGTADPVQITLLAL